MPRISEYGSFMAGGNFIGFIHLLVCFKKKKKERKIKRASLLKPGVFLPFPWGGYDFSVYDNHHRLWDI